MFWVGRTDRGVIGLCGLALIHFEEQTISDKSSRFGMWVGAAQAPREEVTQDLDRPASQTAARRLTERHDDEEERRGLR